METHVQVVKVYVAYAQHTESKSLPSAILCKHPIPPGRRCIVLQT